MKYVVVLIDDNYAIRQLLKIFLSKISQKYSYEIKIFSTDNGAEGLGYVYITSPNIIIIDTSLPKYSGRDLLDYFIKNPKFRNDNTQVIILYEEIKTNLNLPNNFHLIDKKQIDSFQKITDTIKHILGITETNRSKIILEKIGNFIINKNYQNDHLLLEKHSSINLPKIIINRLSSSFLMIGRNLALTILLLIFGRPNDENTIQYDLDKKSFDQNTTPLL